MVYQLTPTLNAVSKVTTIAIHCKQKSNFMNLSTVWLIVSTHFLLHDFEVKIISIYFLFFRTLIKSL